MQHERSVGGLNPTVGILTVRENGRILGNLPLFRAIMKVAEEYGGIAVLFTPSDIDWKNEWVNGYIAQPQTGRKRTERRLFPMFDVVYNRIPNREWEKTSFVQETLTRLRSRYGRRFFNPSFFDKGEIYARINSSPIRSHLPLTEPLHSKESLSKMLKLSLPLYLKPADGRAGDGIIYLEPVRGEEGEETIRIRSTDTGKERTVSSAMIWEILSPSIHHRSYLIQQAIPRLTFAGRPFDLRVLVQKGGEGRWAVTGVGARLAGPERITTHIPQGGSRLSPEEAFSLTMTREERRRKYREIEEVALGIARVIDAGYDQSLGEMSMDLGLSPEGKLWFFEANAKPMKFDEPSIHRRSLIRRMQYFQYLSNLSPSKSFILQ